MRSQRGPAVLLALAGGLVVATQARVNGEFGDLVGNPPAAAMLSAATGLAIVTPIAWLTPRIRVGLLSLPATLRARALPAWTLLAGAVGGFLLFSQTYAVPVLGVALYSVLIVASLTTASLLVDRAGLGPAGPQSVTGNRIGGATLAVAAALLAAGPHLDTGTLALVAALVAIAAGATSAAQSAMLGRLGVGAGQPLAAVWVNFVGAVLTLGVIVAGATAAGAWWRVPPLGWEWLGGPLGLLIVVTIVVTVPRAGVLLVMMALTAGQLTGSLLWDLIAPVSGRGVDAWSVLGAGLLMAAVVLASRPARAPGSN